MKIQNIVLFDFDGTLSAKDCNMQFYKYCMRHSIRPWLFLPISLVGAALVLFARGSTRVTRLTTLSRELMRMHLTQKMVKKLAPGFIKQHKSERFGWALAQVKKERSMGNVVICLSAGPNFLIPALVQDMPFNAVIASQMVKKSPWKYDFFCWGDNKVLVFEAWANANDIVPNVVRAYSDNKSDVPMMNLAEEQVWIDPKTGLRKNP